MAVNADFGRRSFKWTYEGENRIGVKIQKRMGKGKVGTVTRSYFSNEFCCKGNQRNRIIAREENKIENFLKITKYYNRLV